MTRDRYVSNSIDFSRRMYYTDQWQVLEERQEDDPEWLLNKQYVWGIRYIDELILRDNDTTPNGTLNIRHYALQDANFNVVAIVNTNGSVGRRFEYDAYGHSITLEADYSPGAYEYDFEYRYAGYRWDYETHLLQVRNRWYHPRLGRWVSRDHIGYRAGDANLFGYVGNSPPLGTDPTGLAQTVPPFDLKHTVPPSGYSRSRLTRHQRDWQKYHIVALMLRHNTHLYSRPTGIESFLRYLNYNVVPHIAFSIGSTAGTSAIATHKDGVISTDNPIDIVNSGVALHETVHAMNYFLDRYQTDPESDEAMAYGIEAIIAGTGLNPLDRFEKDLSLRGEGGGRNPYSPGFEKKPCPDYIQSRWDQIWSPAVLTSIPSRLTPDYSCTLLRDRHEWLN